VKRLSRHCSEDSSRQPIGVRDVDTDHSRGWRARESTATGWAYERTMYDGRLEVTLLTERIGDGLAWRISPMSIDEFRVTSSATLTLEAKDS